MPDHGRSGIILACGISHNQFDNICKGSLANQKYVRVNNWKTSSIRNNQVHSIIVFSVDQKKSINLLQAHFRLYLSQSQTDSETHAFLQLGYVQPINKYHNINSLYTPLRYSSLQMQMSLVSDCLGGDKQQPKICLHSLATTIRNLNQINKYL